MQVTQVTDHVTHAVIGGGQAMAFGISDDPEMFIMLSSTLYSRKHEAVVRETLCNAWDAHVDAGRTDIPVEVTLTDSKLIIRDRGKGIPHDQMRERYCIYGKSTKRHDGKQTGGFGLGCKAPWAYVDHFEVTCCHGGTKTIYRASKSSVEMGGKPALVPIVSIPCGDETGIQVSLDIKQHDVTLFRKLICRIAAVGEMNVKLNERMLETIPFSQAPSGFLITSQEIGDSGHKIWVRYGNVVYPVESHQNYNSQYRVIVDLLANLNTYDRYKSWSLVLLAEPNTISVTPSRESLSMTDATIQTLQGLLQAFHDQAQVQLEIEAVRLAEVNIADHFTQMRPALLLEGGKSLFFGIPVYRNRLMRGQTQHLTGFDQIAHAYVSRQYPSFKKFRQRDVERRLRALIEFGFGGPTHRGKLQSFLADYQREQKLDPFRDVMPNWFQRRLVAPLLTALKAHPDLGPDRLWVYGRHERMEDEPRSSLRYKRRYRSTNELDFTEAGKFVKAEMEGYLPFLKNLVILSYNRLDVQERADRFPMVRHWFGSTIDTLVYVCQRSEPKVKAAREFWKAQGFTVLDLTQRQAWEPSHVADSVESRPYKPRKAGLPVLSSIFPDGARHIDTALAKADTVTRIAKPEFIVKAGKANSFLDGFDADSSKDIIRLFGDKGGIIVNDTQGAKYKADGAIDLSVYLFEKLAGIQKNPRIAQYLSVDPARVRHIADIVDLGYHEQGVLEIISQDPVLATYFGISHQMTEEDFRYVRIWKELSSSYRNDRRPEMIALGAWKNTIKYSQEMVNLIEQLRSSKLVGMIDRSDLNKKLSGDESTERSRQLKAKARDLLLYAIKG